MSQFLLELRVEEIPAGLQVSGEHALKQAFVKLLLENGIENVDVFTASMSSRIALWVEALPNTTADRLDHIRGPKVGAPEGALNGFMRGHGIADRLDLSEVDGYYVYQKETAGRNVKDVLAEALPNIIRHIPWKKSMRWADGEMTFVRPLSGVLALLDGEVVPFSVDGLASSSKSKGHFFMHPELFDVRSLDHYMSTLEASKVMLSRDCRQTKILEGLSHYAQEKGLRMVQNQALVEEVSGLVEWVYPVMSHVDEKFLDLPKEVLIKTMADDQRYFALEDAEGNLSNFFIGISNMPDEEGNIAKGYTKVLTSRFEDARFYWETDRKEKLEARLSKLEDIVFQKNLGTVADKMCRVKTLLLKMVEERLMPGMDMHKDDLSRTADLAKCDLVSGVVYEFPDLQGKIGSYLAKADGEAETVAEAIALQYKHEGFPEKMGETAIAFILADRLDTLVGFFGINQGPTGSKDPFALRRSALTIVRLVQQFNLNCNLEDLVSKAAECYVEGVLNVSVEEVTKTVVQFIVDRIEVALKEEGVSYDCFRAVKRLASKKDILGLMEEARALSAFMETQEGVCVKKTYDRIANMLKDKNETAFNASEMTEEAEKTLLEAYTKLKDKKEISSLQGYVVPVEKFCDTLQVMSNANRVGLLASIRTQFDVLVDFSALVGR